VKSAQRLLIRHARPRAGHPRLIWLRKKKTWMAGTSPAMTREEHLRIFASDSSVSLDRKNTGLVSQQMFHGKEFEFQRLRKLHK
jgi:hypothetical protein